MSLLNILRILPKRHMSWFVGQLVHAPFPAILANAILRFFVQNYPVNLNEAEKELAEYPTLGDFFVRNLKPGVRPMAPGVVHPVDGVIAEFGSLDEDKLLQVKGRYYSVNDLVRDDALAGRFIGGSFVTYYLAPQDYHHIHSPVDGEVVDFSHIPGSLWPVNDWGVHNIDGLFVANERIVSVIESEFGRVLLIKVGATNVGSISLEYDGLITNRLQDLTFSRREVSHRKLESPYTMARGQRVATFHMGSSVVLVFEPNKVTFSDSCSRGAVKYGEKLGEAS